jgi:glutamate/tyrosine decarboxylase-like PLP-dependent enzyme
MTLLLAPEERRALWARIADAVERYIDDVEDLHPAPELEPTAPSLDPAVVRAFVERFDFDAPADPVELVDRVVEGLRTYQTQVPHPRYYGLFNPAPATMGIAADFLVAAFNPQLAAWSHSPFPVEVEDHLVRAFGGRLGYDPAGTDGTFTSGGAEANHTAVLAALQASFPEWAERGVRALPGQPTMYVSTEGHHSLEKAARMAGLGEAAARPVPVRDDLRMDLEALRARIDTDRRDGAAPFMVIATAGTTSAGTIDEIAAVADVSAAERLWFHVDAAWGGPGVIVPELRPHFAGIERADSIILDAHKWLSVPMGAGMFLTRHPGLLQRTFGVGTPYMPQAAGGGAIDPYVRSMQWSRRFIGLKLFLSLAAAGWEGYVEVLRHQLAMADRLRRGLERRGWEVVNDTPLPLVCFADRGGADPAAIVARVVRSGRAWISIARIGDGRPVIRACITNYRTTAEHVDELIEAADDARDA